VPSRLEAWRRRPLCGSQKLLDTGELQFILFEPLLNLASPGLKHLVGGYYHLAGTSPVQLHQGKQLRSFSIHNCSNVPMVESGCIYAVERIKRGHGILTHAPVV